METFRPRGGRFRGLMARARLNGPRLWLQEAIDAQRRGPTPLARRLTHRVV